MTDKQLLEQFYNEGWREGMPPFEALTDKQRESMSQTIHFAAYRFRFRVIEFWQAVGAAINDIQKQNNSKK